MTKAKNTKIRTVEKADPIFALRGVPLGGCPTCGGCDGYFPVEQLLPEVPPVLAGVCRTHHLSWAATLPLDHRNKFVPPSYVAELAGRFNQSVVYDMGYVDPVFHRGHAEFVDHMGKGRAVLVGGGLPGDDEIPF